MEDGFVEEGLLFAVDGFAGGGAGGGEFESLGDGDGVGVAVFEGAAGVEGGFVL